MSLFDQFGQDGTRQFPFWWSVYWLGPTQIPPLTMNIGLTDRNASKTVWYPYVGNNGHHIHFTTAKPPGPVRVYAPFDGPFVGQSGLRMGIMSGHVVVDQPGQNDAGPGPFCRGLSNNLLAAVIFAIYTTGGGNYYDHLAFQSDNVQGGIFDPTP